MTKQETFKARVRARMANTGERYLEARRVLLAQTRPVSSTRQWASMPEMSDEAIRGGSGRSWDEWCDLIDRFGGDRGHRAIAEHVRDDHEIDGWWAQAVTVGYERIAGLRLPHQMADGTFTANKSRTVVGDAEELRRALLDDEARRDLFPNIDTELRSRPTAKAIRLRIGGGIATITLDEQAEGRVKIVVGHQKLQSLDAVEEWKFYWNEWLDAVGS